MKTMKYLLIFAMTAMVMLLATNRAMAQTNLPGLVSWWKGNGNANDSAGTNNGVINGTVTYTNGLLGRKAFFLNSGYVSVPNSPSLSFTSTAPITVALLVYRTSNSDPMHLVGKRSGCQSGGSALNYQMALNQGSGEGLVFGDGGGNEVATGGDLPINSWHQLVGTFDGTTYRFYLDGYLQASQAGTLGDPIADALLIGEAGSCNGFVGFIQDVQLYNRALSANEVQQLYRSDFMPTIIAQPVSRVVSPGSSVTFSIQAFGQPGPTFQWRFNGVPIIGATNTNYTINPTTITNIGLYDVGVANFIGTNYSTIASLGFIDLKMLAGVYVTGPSGANYNIQSTPVIPGTNWITLTNVTLSTQPYIYIDYSSPTNVEQFYRAVPLP